MRPISCVSWSPNRMDLFGLGMDSQAFHNPKACFTSQPTLGSRRAISRVASPAPSIPQVRKAHPTYASPAPDCSGSMSPMETSSTDAPSNVTVRRNSDPSVHQARGPHREDSPQPKLTSLGFLVGGSCEGRRSLKCGVDLRRNRLADLGGSPSEFQGRVGPRFAANAYLGRNSSRSRLNVTRLASAGPDRGR
jgi:hypothetical protein